MIPVPGPGVHPPTQWYGRDLGAQPPGQGKGPQIADTRGDLGSKMSKINPTRGPQPQGGRGRSPTSPSKLTKNKQN